MFWLIFENLGIKCWFVFKFSKTLKINLIYAAKAAQGWSFVGFCGPKQKVQNRLEPMCWKAIHALDDIHQIQSK